jgi:nitrate/nitrite transporter NarK
LTATAQGNLVGYVAPYILGLAKDTTGRLEVGLEVMAATMIAGALLTHFLPRKALIERPAAPRR